jgi:hypothetical protein
MCAYFEVEAAARLKFAGIKPLPVQETTHNSEQNDIPGQPPKAEYWKIKDTLSKFQTLPEVTCVYGMDGKCSGTITPQCLSISQDAYNSARHQGKHLAETPCPKPCNRN